MKQNGKSRGKSMHLEIATLSSTKEAKIYNSEKIVSSTSGTGKTGQLQVEEWN